VIDATTEKKSTDLRIAGFQRHHKHVFWNPQYFAKEFPRIFFEGNRATTGGRAHPPLAGQRLMLVQMPRFPAP
jgi:hypothetical protein